MTPIPLIEFLAVVEVAVLALLVMVCMLPSERRE